MNIDLLNSVKKRLQEDIGQLRIVASSTGIPYDTVLRIKNGEGDPGYSKVQAIAEYYALADAAQSDPKINTAATA